MMPQEVEVWYVLPAIRREIAKAMKKMEVDRVSEDGTIKVHKITQKEIAKMLGVTEPAITQYLLPKKDRRSRGDQVVIPEDMLAVIEKSAETMVESFESGVSERDMYEIMTKQINRIIRTLRDAGVMCDIHRQFCSHVKDDCDACEKNR
jgi:predicted transcriptional regulator